MLVNWKEINTKSNYLSIFRLLMAIPFFILIDKIIAQPDYRLIVFGMCILAYLTDIGDGYLARKYNEITEFGKIIDPLADKIVIITIALKLFLIGEIPAYYFYIIIARDVIIFTGGIYVTKRIKKVLPSNLLGKITVLTIGIYLIAVILNIKEFSLVHDILMINSIFFSVASVIGYFIRGFESIKWYCKDGNI